VASIDVGAYDAILVAGGQGPMFTFEKATALHRKFVEFYEAGKIACALCHGVAVLRYARLSNGEYLAKGKCRLPASPTWKRISPTMRSGR
jgi:putative intracellular protease/amidase